MLMIAAVVPAAALGQEPAQASDLVPSALEDRIRGEMATTESGRMILAHRPTYVLPLTYSFNPNDPPDVPEGEDPIEYDDVEIKFQFSLKARVIDSLFGDQGALYVAYTQLSLWQAYNFEDSSPFRDTNYEPELFLTFDTDFNVLGLRHRLLTLGAVHQSNGRGSEQLSRSWNRLYASFLFNRGNFVLAVKPWYRIPENEEDDNNPDIEDYLGYGDLKMAYVWRGMELATLLRYNFDFDESRGAVQLDWTFPLVKEIRGYVQYWNGYGECLLDYDHRDERIGIGFLLGDWL